MGRTSSRRHQCTRVQRKVLIFRSELGEDKKSEESMPLGTKWRQKSDALMIFAFSHTPLDST